MMCDYMQAREDRVVTFQRHLELMVQRRSKERAKDCAIIFSDTPPDDAGVPKLKAKARKRISAAVANGREPGPESFAAADEGPSNDRFVQFAFMTRTFYLDLPRTTIFPGEVLQLRRQRHGFFLLKERRWCFQCHEEWVDLVRKFDPLEKEYLNPDTRAAAEDMAFIWYTLWKYPLDTPLYWKAFRFNSGTSRSWEGCGIC